MSDVTDLLDELVDGLVDVDAVVAVFAGRVWPRRTRVVTGDVTDLYVADLADPVSDPEGAFSEVAAYLAQHRIDAEQYRVLADAAARAMADAPPPGSPAGAVNERSDL